MAAQVHPPAWRSARRFVFDMMVRTPQTGLHLDRSCLSAARQWRHDAAPGMQAIEPQRLALGGSVDAGDRLMHV